MSATATLERNAVLAGGLTSLTWGLTGVFVRLLPPVSPLAITSARLLGSLVVALPILAISRIKRLDLKVAVKNPVGYVLASLLAGYYLLATAAFQLAPVAEVALLLSTPPLFVLALRRMNGDVPTVFEILGASLAVAGIALILAPRLTRTEGLINARLIGDALAICAALLTAFYACVYRGLAKNGAALESSSITFMTFSLGSVVMIGATWLIPTTISWRAFSGAHLPSFLGLVVLCTAVPSFAFSFASKHLPPVVTATISLLIPLFAGGFAYLILGEKISSTAIPGSALVVVGIVIILRQNSRSTASPASL